ncbi:hypothetical protein LEN26_019232 [Aphanomyces euteiches]|nr:hypothetical protein LEN26_019232 [Aphanomyces euteiches]KAH9124384.1 hypothetical protein AeMF1_004844 [Aphanomyces euteiches]KAH9185596.1 hypothetical protein AeNC1_012424 [Aphanomyces euteiches]
MTFSIDDIPDQTGRVAVVTGGTAGLGLQSVIALARKGCHVIFTARVLLAVKKQSRKSNNTDLASVSAFADSFLARKLALHILLNAGVAMVPYNVVHGVESTLFVNHVAHQLLAIRLLSALKRCASARVVILSSSAHAMASSVDFNLPTNNLFAQALLKRVDRSKIFVNIADPGLVTTDIMKNGLDVAHYPRLLQPIVQIVGRFIFYTFGTAPEKGVLTQLYLATSSDVEKNQWQGEYFTPVAKLDTATPLSRDPVQVDRLWHWTNDVIDRVLANE